MIFFEFNTRSFASGHQCKLYKQLYMIVSHVRSTYFSEQIVNDWNEITIG